MDRSHACVLRCPVRRLKRRRRTDQGHLEDIWRSFRGHSVNISRRRMEYVNNRENRVACHNSCLVPSISVSLRRRRQRERERQSGRWTDRQTDRQTETGAQSRPRTNNNRKSFIVYRWRHLQTRHAHLTTLNDVAPSPLSVSRRNLFVCLSA